MDEKKYMPVDPDLWADFEVSNDEAKNQIANAMSEMTQLLAKANVLLLHHEELMDTPGGLALTGISMVVGAMMSGVKTGDYDLLGEMYQGIDAAAKANGL